MDLDLVRLYGLIFAPTAVALIDMLRFRRPTWRAAGEKRLSWAVLVLLAPWLGPGLYATGPRLRLTQAVERAREAAAGVRRAPGRELRIVAAEGDLLEDWRQVAATLATAPGDDDLEQLAVRHRLTLAYVDDVLVGHAEMRPPTDEDHTAGVTVRILPEHRGHGWGEAYVDVEAAVARGYGPTEVDVVVEDDTAG